MTIRLKIRAADFSPGFDQDGNIELFIPEDRMINCPIFTQDIVSALQSQFGEDTAERILDAAAERLHQEQAVAIVSSRVSWG